MSPVARLVLLGTAWLMWLAPFFAAQLKGTSTPVKMDPRARWGILLAALGFYLTFMHGPKVWRSEIPAWRFALAAIFAPVGIVLSWSAVRNLGKQWRMDAGLNADHELVRSGPYRVIRHPIYASMLAMLLTGVAAVGTLPGWPIGLVLFLAGTEIRVRIEDRLLRSRFGRDFDAWEQAVPAYIPFVR